MGVQFFIDETKAKGYVVVAVMCPDSALAPVRRVLGRLVLPGQRSIHMKHESPRRRRQIADAVSGLTAAGVQAFIVDAGRGPEPEVVRRGRALCAIVKLASRHDAASIVIDLDQTLIARDARTLAAAIREARSASIVYSHQPLGVQPLLAIPDVVAWCWARGGEWRRRVSPIVSDVIEV